MDDITSLIEELKQISNDIAQLKQAVFQVDCTSFHADVKQAIELLNRGESQAAEEKLRQAEITLLISGDVVGSVRPLQDFCL